MRLGIPSLKIGEGAPTGLLAGLLAYWKLEEASGTRDAVFGSFPLTDVNTVTGNPGIIGNAAQFTAANSERLDSIRDLTLSGECTISMWVFLDTIVDGSGFGGGGASFHSTLTGDPSIGDWWIGFNSTGAINFYHQKVNGNDNTGRHKTNTTPLTTGSFQHIVARKLAGVASIWHNGISQAMQAPNSTGNGWGNTKFSMGTAWVGGAALYSHDGRIDEMGIWRRGLTNSEIAAIYNAGIGLTYPF